MNEALRTARHTNSKLTSEQRADLLLLHTHANSMSDRCTKEHFGDANRSNAIILFAQRESGGGEQNVRAAIRKPTGQHVVENADQTSTTRRGDRATGTFGHPLPQVSSCR